MAKFIQLDEEGYFLSQGLRVNDQDYGQELLRNLYLDGFGGLGTRYQELDIVVEAFDAPLLIKQIHLQETDWWEALCPYGYKVKVKANSLRADEWDRFHAESENGLPMVFNRSAQADLFNSADEFTDETITLLGHRYEVPPYLQSPTDTQPSDFWTQKYLSQESPGWELNAPSPLLVDSLPQLKIPRSRVLVPGCGSGNDAAHLAQQGHIVTAIDYSEEAIRQAKEKYGQIKNLEFHVADVFNLDASYKQAFDLIFEHTCMCAVPLEKRQELVNVWRQCLDEQGHLLAVLFVMHRLHAPPFGGTEWEYRQRLQKHFDFRYWTRWQKDESWRRGKELLVYGQKKNEETSPL